MLVRPALILSGPARPATMTWPKQDVDYVRSRLVLNGASTAAIVVLLDKWSDSGVRSVRRYVDAIRDLPAEIREAETWAALEADRRSDRGDIIFTRSKPAASDKSKRWPSTSS